MRTPSPLITAIIIPSVYTTFIIIADCHRLFILGIKLYLLRANNATTGARPIIQNIENKKFTDAFGEFHTDNIDNYRGSKNTSGSYIVFLFAP
jgi:hypothetical protein